MEKNLTFLKSLLFVFISVSLSAQVTGTITSTKGDTLSFASIYQKGTSRGTSSNIEGKYQLDLAPGKYQLVFQYVGYESHIEELEIAAGKIKLDVSLKPQSYELQEITVSANGEDPAYAIIRKAIEKRSYYRDLIQSFKCKVYVKGNQKILSIPEKILGQEIGDLDGMLDSTRRGIVYLSETVSEYYFDKGESKEVIISSKLSGNDNGYSFNSAQEMEFNIYENSFKLNREIVSPIANNALSYYKYKLEGSFYDKDQKLINKIKVSPKRVADPAVEGYIYIIEDLWNVHSFRLNVPKQATQLPFLDSLILNQVYVPLADPDVYKLFSNTISFEMKLFGVHLDGKFSAVYSDYNLNPKFEDDFFNNEVYKVEEESNKRNYEYWDSIRPVPLTNEEHVDYVRKDSLQIVKKSPAYLDSIDRVNNKFKVSSLLFGYSYQNSLRKSRFSFGSLFDNFQYNTVQGYNVNPQINYRKYFNENETRRLRLGANLNYGFSEKQIRINGAIEYLFNKIDFSRLRIRGGQKIEQFDSKHGISNFENTFYSLLFRRNWAKFYDKKFLSIEYEKEYFNGFYSTIQLEYTDRFQLENNSNASYFYKDSRIFSTNKIININDNIGDFNNNKAIIFSMDSRIRFGQKYYSYPHRKFTSGSKYPDFWIHLKQGLYAINSASNFTHLALTIRDKANFGVYGSLDYRVNAGMFFNQESLSFVDYKHFHGDQTFLSNPDNYNSSFLLLPYYYYSNSDKYVQTHLQYHFNGFIMDKLPLLNKLGWQLVGGAKHLYTPDLNYNEFHVGLDNIGFGIFKIFRLDFVWSFEDLKYEDFGMRLGIGF